MAECVVRPTLAGYSSLRIRRTNHCLVTDQTVRRADATDKK